MLGTISMFVIAVAFCCHPLCTCHCNPTLTKIIQCFYSSSMPYLLISYLFCKPILLIHINLTFNVQSELTSKLPGLMSRCRMLAECRYFKPSSNHTKNINMSNMLQKTKTESYVIMHDDHYTVTTNIIYTNRL